jgi:hypothetical protein
MPALIENNNQPNIVAKSKSVYSTPVSKEAKQFLINESARTGLSQKELVDKAIVQLQRGPRIPTVLPIQL